MSKVIQTQLEKFHKTIKLDMGDLKPVIEKRDMLIGEIRTFFKKKAEEDDEPEITFTIHNQGSYASGTGVEPAFDQHDYDIDVALVFNIGKDDYTSLQIKKWVHDALTSQFRTVEWKKPCIRVQYNGAGVPKFHVDFAIYSSANCNADGKTYLAKGKPTISADQNKWELSDAKRLLSLIEGKHSNALAKAQFKRIIRYMKRWKDNNFSSVNGKPTGIALTALAYDGFAPRLVNDFSGLEEISDLKACLEFVKYILNQFSWFTIRIAVHLPVAPGNDLFAKMTDEQCKTFKVELTDLKTALQAAVDETDPVAACKVLRKQFGTDFEVLPKEETAQSRGKAVVGSTESA